MAQTVDKLKELLFDSEARAITELNQRLGSVEQSAAASQVERREINRQVDELLQRAGTTERFEVSVASVLDGALRKAEIERHTELASAIAPLVVRTVKTEIRNSRDELVEALYPMTGRMVQAYVASAMKDLAHDINRRLEQNAFMLRLRSLASGKSVAEVAMADTQRIHIEELYLIRRASGELIGRWPEPSDLEDSHDHVMSGVLTAINEFSSQAFQSNSAGLRQIDIGDRRLYLRASPQFLLAAKCSGTAQPPLEAVLDQAFVTAIERLHAVPSGYESDAISARTNILQNLSSGIESELDEKAGEIAEQTAGLSPLKMMVYLIGLPLAAFMMWTLLGYYHAERVQTLAERVRATMPEISGYPVTLDVAPRGHRLTVSGLTPTNAVKAELIERLQRVVPDTVIENQLTALPNDLANVEPQIAGVNRNLEQLAPEIARVRQDMAALKTSLAQATATQAIVKATARLKDSRSVLAAGPQSGRGLLETIDKAIAGLSQSQRTIDMPVSKPDQAARDIAAVTSLVHSAHEKVADLAGIAKPVAVSSVPGASGTAVSVVSETLADDAGALLAAAQILSQSDKYAKDSAKLAARSETLAAELAALRAKEPPKPVVTPVSDRDRLLAFTRANAVFFKNDTELKDPARVDADLDELIKLLRSNALLIRVVGYTDGQGTPAVNATLSDSRARVVVDRLVARGLPRNRIVALGRVDAIGISPDRGLTSPNRRVEFEVGFEGEGENR